MIDQIAIAIARNGTFQDRCDWIGDSLVQDQRPTVGERWHDLLSMFLLLYDLTTALEIALALGLGPADKHCSVSSEAVLQAKTGRQGYSNVERGL